MDDALKDERFSHILKDPRFRKIPRNVRKIKVDKRFTDMFSNREFNEKSKLDERGRALNLRSAENLEKLYNVTNDTSEDEIGDDQEMIKNDKSVKNKKTKKKHLDESLKIDEKANKKRNKQIMVKNVNLGEEESDSSEISENEDNSSKQTDSCKKTKIPDATQKSSKQPKNIRKSSEKALNKSKIRDTDVTPDSLKNSAKQSKAKQSSGVDGSTTNKFESSEEDELADNGNQTKLSKKQIKTENLEKHFNNISDERFQSIKKDRQEKVGESSDEDESDSSEEESQEDSNLEDDSEDSSSDESSSHNEEEFDHHWEELHEEAEDTDEITRRLAVCNMDWDRIRADDLFVVFDSFKPADGSVLSVKIYPSEFGLQRMEEEKLNGPPELVEKTLDPDEEEVEDKKGSKYNREKLRQYQIKRLKYFYAVVECDTPETASHLYNQLNTMEYESSAVRFDLRFIPDDTTFDQEPTSIAEKTPDPTEYKPKLFVTTALQQVKVNLTWDETDPQRKETLQKAFTDPDSIEKDIRDYLASSSDESEVEENEDSGEEGGKLSTADRIAKYRALLLSVEEKDKKESEKYEMEISWDPGLKEKTEKKVKEKIEDTTNPFDELLKKKKEQRKLKKQKKKVVKSEEDEIMSDSEESDSHLYSDGESSKQPLKQDSKQIDELYLLSNAKVIDKPQEKGKSKGKKFKKSKKEAKIDEFKCDVMDPRFSAIYSSHDYNIDPSDPHFKKTDGTMAIIQEKQKRVRKKIDLPETEERKTKKMKYR